MQNIFHGSKNHFILHIRLTKKCNADCSYCSSFESKASSLMVLDDAKKSLNFIKDLINKLGLGGQRNSITVQYIGGEILTVPTNYLKEFTNIVKNELSPLFKDFRHGVQSNLISSSQKIDSLFEIFETNIGTSFDSHTEQRTVKKDHNKYNVIFLKNISHIKKKYGKNMSGVVVLDKKMGPHLFSEIVLRNSKKQHITIRPVFNGGSSVDELSIEEILFYFNQSFDNWIMKQNIIIEPFYSYLNKRIKNKKGLNFEDISGCPSQHNCAMVSLNLDPNGDLYICQDMADAKQYCIGNAINKTLNIELYEKIKNRTNNLNSDCLSCDYFKECQGGCMSEAIHHHNDMYGKTSYCIVWKSLFSKIDKAIDNYGYDEIQKWLENINKY